MLRKYNVLIVEDDPTMRVVIKHTLSTIDLEVGEIFEANHGKEGLEILEQHSDIDLMLIDLYMPVMDGMDMLDYTRDHPDYKDIPAIIISTENDENRIDAILRKGLGFVHKPLTKDLLNGQVQKYLSTKE